MSFGHISTKVSFKRSQNLCANSRSPNLWANSRRNLHTDLDFFERKKLASSGLSLLLKKEFAPIFGLLLRKTKSCTIHT